MVINYNENRKYRALVLVSFALYIFLYCFYYVVGSKGKIDSWVTVAQFFFAFEYLILFLVLQNKRQIQVSAVIFITSLLNTFIVQSLFIEHGFTVFGPDPIDAYNYLYDAQKTARLTLSETFRYFASETATNYEFGIDDYGMSLIARAAYILGGSKEGYASALLFLNSIFITTSSYIINKLVRLYDIEKVSECDSVNKTTNVALLFGLCFSFQMFSVYGLKENFFLFFTLLALYNSTKFLIVGGKKTLFYAGFAICSLCLFRFAVCAQLGGALLIVLLLKNTKHKKTAIFILCILGAISLKLLDFIIIFLGGSGLENMLLMAELRNTSSSGSAVVSYLSQIIFSAIGQPAYFVGEFGFSHLATFSLLIKNLVSIYFIIGIISLLKYFDSKYWMLFAYWLLGTFMLAMAIRGSDFRYSCLYEPALLLIAARGLKCKNSVRYSNVIASGVVSIVFIFIFMWNRN